MSANTTGIDAHYVLVKDLERAKAFYKTTLGLEPTTTFPQGVEYILDDGSAFGLSQPPDGSYVQSGGIMFAVDDIPAAQERVKAAGGTLFGEPSRGPACTILWCSDTEGNPFCLHRRD
jgi:predicted enzyme related to lactoylglutathione lyase